MKPGFFQPPSGMESGGTINGDVAVAGSVLADDEGAFAPVISTGKAAVTTGFAGTVSSSGTTVTFSEEADAILAGYDASHPRLGTTIVAGGQTRYISAWASATECTVTTAPSPAWSADAITSAQGPVAVLLKSDGTFAGWVNAAGEVYLVAGISGTTGTFSGAVSAALPRVVKNATGSLLAAECLGTLVTNKAQSDDATISLPALAEGLVFVAYAETTVAKYWRFDPNGSEIIRKDGTALTGGYYVGVASVAEGNEAVFKAVYNNAGALVWSFTSVSGTWVAQS